MIAIAGMSRTTGARTTPATDFRAHADLEAMARSHRADHPGNACGGGLVIQDRALLLRLDDTAAVSPPARKFSSAYRLGPVVGESFSTAATYRSGPIIAVDRPINLPTRAGSSEPASLTCCVPEHQLAC